MEFEFTGPLWYWKGPAPWHFVTVPDGPSAELEASAAMLTYGWGMIPVMAGVGGSRWTTSLWPKDGGYVLPVKASVRRRENLELGDLVEVRLEVAG